MKNFNKVKCLNDDHVELRCFHGEVNGQTLSHVEFNDEFYSVVWNKLESESLSEYCSAVYDASQMLLKYAQYLQYIVRMEEERKIK